MTEADEKHSQRFKAKSTSDSCYIPLPRTVLLEGQCFGMKHCPCAAMTDTYTNHLRLSLSDIHTWTLTLFRTKQHKHKHRDRHLAQTKNPLKSEKSICVKTRRGDDFTLNILWLLFQRRKRGGKAFGDPVSEHIS